MAVVRMLVGFSGTRNGEDWPPAGGVVDLPDVEAAKYVQAGLAEAVDGAPVEAAVAAPVEKATVPAAPRKRQRGLTKADAP